MTEEIIPTTRKSRRLALVAGLVVSLVVAGTGAATAAVRYDARNRSVALTGVTVGGVDIGGLTFTTAQFRLREKYEVPLERTIKVRAGGETFETTPRALGAKTNSLDLLKEVFASQDALPLWQRIWLRVTRAPVGSDFKVTTDLSRSKIEAFVDKIAGSADRTSSDATISLVDGELRIGPEVNGFKLDRKAATESIDKAIHSGNYNVPLEGQTQVAELRKAQISHVLVIKVGENKILHYNGENLVKTYDVATGLPGYPTPKGLFKIVNKRRNPSWGNPAKYPGGWGWSLPARIGPGPNNPLGTRALDLNVSGIRIHGTSATYSIGYNASHGCIRMRRAEVEELFDILAVDTPVLIVQSGGYRLMPARTAPAPTQPEPTAESDATPIPGQDESPPPSDPPA